MTNTAAIQSAPTGAFLQESERVFKLAGFLAQSDIIPKHFQGKTANCFLALEMSQRLSINFFELVNGLYVVHGSPAFSGAFTISMINRSGLFPGGLNFRREGEGLKMQVTAWAKRHTGELCSAVVSMEMAKAEGWTKNSKYATMPDHMLTYRAATFFCRRYCPEILMGARTLDEIEDIQASKHVVDSVPTMMLDMPSDALLDNLEITMKNAIDGGVEKEKIDDIYSKLNFDNRDSIKQGIDFLANLLADTKGKK